MTDEEMVPHLEAVIRWADHKLKSNEGSWKNKYYFIGLLDNLRALLTDEETLVQFFERKVLNPHGFTNGELVKIGDKWTEVDKPKILGEME